MGGTRLAAGPCCAPQEGPTIASLRGPFVQEDLKVDPLAREAEETALAAGVQASWGNIRAR